MALSTPILKISEQPESQVRMRYVSERGRKCYLQGEHSTNANPTYPAVQVEGYHGDEELVVEVTFVTEDFPYRIHPHNMLPGPNCENCVCLVDVCKNTMTAVFPHLAVQCVIKKDVKKSLRLRQQNNIDPFNQGFNHANQINSINLNCIRLCYRLMTKKDRRVLCSPIVSNPIYKRNTQSPPNIFKLHTKSAPMDGGSEVWLMCSKIDREDIRVRFYTKRKNQGGNEYDWVAAGTIKEIFIQPRTVIIVETPPYTGRLHRSNTAVNGYVELYLHSNGKTSDPHEFRFLPSYLALQHNVPNTYTHQPQYSITSQYDTYTTTSYHYELLGDLREPRVTAHPTLSITHPILSTPIQLDNGSFSDSNMDSTPGSTTSSYAITSTNAIHSNCELPTPPCDDMDFKFVSTTVNEKLPSDGDDFIHTSLNEREIRSCIEQTQPNPWAKINEPNNSSISSLNMRWSIFTSDTEHDLIKSCDIPSFYSNE